MDDRYRLRCAQARAALDALALPRDTSPEEIKRHIEALREAAAPPGPDEGELSAETRRVSPWVSLSSSRRAPL